MSNKDLVEDSGLTERTLITAKKELQDKKFIKVHATNKQHEKTNYIILPDLKWLHP